MNLGEETHVYFIALPLIKHTKSSWQENPGNAVSCNTGQSTGRARNGPNSKQENDWQGLPAYASERTQKCPIYQFP